ncbi:MAG: hypothetical protein IKU57_03770 [Oscillospiraceae bacterium]|nr:hypothetical protein [Oscillospiraceae bacterium]
MNKKIRIVGILALAVIWLGLTAFAWLRSPSELSTSERRPLDQFPELNAETLLDTSFMRKFEEYTLDQFPLRDTFRQIKALFHYNVMGQKDNNDIYVADGYAAKMDYPLNKDSVEHAIKQFNIANRLYLQKNNCKVYATVVPDKSYYLAEESGHLSMDHEAMCRMIAEGMPWATYVDITDALKAEDYYRTDTHWRQEKLLPVAEKLTQAMGVSAFAPESMQISSLDRPFYGVYHGQAALPLAPDTMEIMTNDVLKECIVSNAMGEVLYKGVHDMTKQNALDLYDVFLSGLEEPLVIENPNAKTDKKLVVFRDSFGSSLVPLLARDYAKITLVDIRKTSTQITGLGGVDFQNADVLFMYSALVLNGNYI